MAPILSVRELLWFPLKLANFLKICDTGDRKVKHFKSFPWIYDLVVINNVMADGGIMVCKNYRFM